MDSRSGLPWPRAAALAAGVVVAAVLSGVVGLGLIPAVGLPAVAVTLAALGLLLLPLAVHLLLLPGERIFAYRGVALAVAFLFGGHLAAALALFGGRRVPDGVVAVLIAGAFVLLAVAALDSSTR